MKQVKTQKSYYIDGQIKSIYVYYLRDNEIVPHCEDGPAITGFFIDGKVSTECYYIDGDPHRIDGPAIVDYFENGTKHYCWYYLFGNIVLEKDFYTPGFIDAFILEHS